MGKRAAILTAAKVLAVLVVLVVLYLVLRGIGFREVVEAIKGADAASVCVSVALFFVVCMLFAFRMRLMMDPGERVSLFALVPVYMAGVFGNCVTPGARVGGEPIRVYYMGKMLGGSRSGHLGVLLAAKLGNLSVYFLFLMMSVAFVAVYAPIGLAPKIVLEGAVILIIVGIVSGVMLRRHIGVSSGLLGRLLRTAYNIPLLRSARHFPTYEHLEEYVIQKLDNVMTPIGRAAKNPWVLAELLVVSLVTWLLFYLAHYVLFVGLGADVDFLRVIVIVTVSTFCGELSATPGGAGLIEAVMIGMCAAFGVDAQTAAAVTLISRGIFYAYGLGVGGVSLAVLAAIYGRRRNQSAPAEGDDAVGH